MKASFSLAAIAGSLLVCIVSLADASSHPGEEPRACKPTIPITDYDGLIMPYPDEVGWPRLDPPLPGPCWPKSFPAPWLPDPCPTRPKLPQHWPYPNELFPGPWPWLKSGIYVQPYSGYKQSNQH